MKLAILSDTHGLLRPQLLEQLQTADAILHAGDINTQAIVEQLKPLPLCTLCGATTTKTGPKAFPMTAP